MLILPNPSLNIIGIDEAGRGALAGPVVAAAVYISDDSKILGQINDSKKLSAGKRNEIFELIINDPSFYYSIKMVHAKRIDQINILQATYEAMHSCVDALSDLPEPTLWIDGNRFKAMKDIDHECIVKGDGKVLSIAAAGILAKVTRDRYMEKLHDEFPMYGWFQNKAYGTKAHRDAIKKYGQSKYHRKSFKLKEKLSKPRF